MNANQKHIIQDYLRRYAWVYVLGALVHLLTAITITHQSGILLYGLIGGSGFLLGIEFSRGGNTTNRTILAMPITASQLVSVWRFVALIFPAVLFCPVLLVGVLIGKVLGGNQVSFGQIVALVILQTGMLGLFFFALTGLQARSAIVVGFGAKCSGVFFGLLWGGSFLVAGFSRHLQVASYHELTAVHLLVWVFLAVVTIAGWFRAEILVARHTVRRSTTITRSHTPRVKGEMPWRRFGGLRYFMARVGGKTLTFFLVMLFATWFWTNLLSVPNSLQSTVPMVLIQLNMFIPIAGLIAVFQLFPMLRTIRAMPQRLSSLTRFMILWPLFLIVLFSVVGHGFHALDSGQEQAWVSYGIRIARSVAGGAMILLTLPLFLRFGTSIKSVFPMMLFVMASNTLGMLTEKVWKIGPAQQWVLFGIILATVLSLSWFLTCRALGSEHPWRAKQFKFGSLRRAT